MPAELLWGQISTPRFLDEFRCHKATLKEAVSQLLIGCIAGREGWRPGFKEDCFLGLLATQTQQAREALVGELAYHNCNGLITQLSVKGRFHKFNPGPVRLP